MAKPKSGRNKLFLEDWQGGLNNESLAERYNLSVGGVKALKSRLRQKVLLSILEDILRRHQRPRQL